VGAGTAAYERFVTDTTQRIADRGTLLACDYLPAPLAQAAGTGLQMMAESHRQGSGLLNGFVQNAVVAPANFFTSFVPDAISSGGESLRPFGQLADRFSDATPLGRGLEIGFRAVMGGYGSVDEFSADVRTRLNPFGIAGAQLGLGRDLFVGLTAEARQDFATGHYGRGVGRVLGDIFDVGTVVGALSRGGCVASALGNAADGLGDAARIGEGIAQDMVRLARDAPGAAEDLAGRSLPTMAAGRFRGERFAFGTAARSERVSVLVDDAARASGIPDLSGLVDDVVYDRAGSYFTVISGRRILSVGDSAFGRTRLGQLQEAGQACSCSAVREILAAWLL
jgi:hypothetical protein